MHWVREFARVIGELPGCPQTILKHYPCHVCNDGYVTLVFTMAGPRAGSITIRHNGSEASLTDYDLDNPDVIADICSTLLQAFLFMQFGLLDTAASDEWEVPKDVVTLEDAIRYIVYLLHVGEHLH